MKATAEASNNNVLGFLTQKKDTKKLKTISTYPESNDLIFIDKKYSSRGPVPLMATSPFILHLCSFPSPLMKVRCMKTRQIVP
jgi:hypothetical protein